VSRRSQRFVVYEVFDILSLILADEGDFAGADSVHARAVKVADDEQRPFRLRASRA